MPYKYNIYKFNDVRFNDDECFVNIVIDVEDTLNAKQLNKNHKLYIICKILVYILSFEGFFTTIYALMEDYKFLILVLIEGFVAVILCCLFQNDENVTNLLKSLKVIDFSEIDNIDLSNERIYIYYFSTVNNEENVEQKISIKIDNKYYWKNDYIKIKVTDLGIDVYIPLYKTYI